MNKICEFCAGEYNDSLSTCPSCGGANSTVRRSVGVPKTIEELKEYYVFHKFPPKEVTRFFIDEDYKEAKAYGIYKDDSGKFIVYKNKADGTRAIRYCGNDESYAVNEIYLKLNEELAAQPSRRANNKTKYNKIDSIEALKEFYDRQQYPPSDVTGFYIGENTDKPNAIGIYNQENSILSVVYKNRSNGSQKIIFKNWDESVAVEKILFIMTRKLGVPKKDAEYYYAIDNAKKHYRSNTFFYAKVLLVSLFLISLIFSISVAYFGDIKYKKTGYYNIDDSYYYQINGDWYFYDDAWTPCEEPAYDGNLSSYKTGESFNGDYSSFEDSDYYDNYHSSGNNDSDDWDSGWDSDYDSGGWDSGGDWDSDW